ncbi:hypothetical protein Scep_027488 [Stephania cephalantha]|uniref:Uncharacterized protein n=1 Tax=Stephania cephalantha TaxID=152367 RepID=A0AAP0E885_9MAGN
MTPDLPLGSEHDSHWTGPPSGGRSSALVAAVHRRHYSGGGGFAALDRRRGGLALPWRCRQCRLFGVLHQSFTK